MTTKMKTLVYPFDSDFCPILRHNLLLEKFDISYLVSPNGWSFCSKDASAADKGDMIGICVEYDFAKCVNDCDVVLLADSSRDLDFHKHIMPNISYAMSKGKDVYCMRKLTVEQSDCLGVLAKKYSIKLVNYCNLYSEGHNHIPVNGIYEIKTPVIFVIGSAQNTCKFEIQLALRETMLDYGYNVSQVGTRHYCEFLGFHSFPDFMYSQYVSETDKILLFSRYIKMLESQEKPDVIVIGIPGGIMPISKKFTNYFGVLAYEVSQAILPDAVVFSVLYEDYKQEYYSLIDTTTKYKLGFNIDCFNLSNTQFDVMTSDQTDKISYLTLDSSFINTKKEAMVQKSVPLFNIHNKNDSKKMVDFIIDRISSDIIEKY